MLRRAAFWSRIVWVGKHASFPFLTRVLPPPRRSSCWKDIVEWGELVARGVLVELHQRQVQRILDTYVRDGAPMP